MLVITGINVPLSSAKYIGHISPVYLLVFLGRVVSYLSNNFALA